jgi:hypothetical protein
MIGSQVAGAIFFYGYVRGTLFPLEAASLLAEVPSSGVLRIETNEAEQVGMVSLPLGNRTEIPSRFFNC